MTLHVGSNKIKDTGAYGVYFCPGKTNCLTYTPKNVNLTLSNGTLTLKAGSKVYVPNGKNADGSLKFDEVTVSSDVVFHSGTIGSGTLKMMLVCKSDGTFGFRGPKDTHFCSGNTDTLSGEHVWYDTANNVIKYYNSDGSFSYNLSLPIGVYQRTSGVATSIDQIFDWCGYIGSTAFVLPGVKGLIPNGFNADGTYKSIEFETDKVLVATRTWNVSTTTAQTIFIQNPGKEMWFANNYVVSEVMPTTNSYVLWYNPKDNILRCNDTGSNVTNVSDYPVTDRLNVATTGLGNNTPTITSLTPYSVKTTNDLQTVNAIYNGSQKVYQYLPTGKTFNPSGSFQTYVVPKGVTKLQVDCVAAKGNGNGYGGRVQCVLSVTPGQTLYLAVGSASTSAATPTYNASDIRTNGNGITDTTSLQSRLVVAGGGGNTGNQAGTGGHGGGLTGAAGSDVDGKSGKGGTQTGGGAGGGSGLGGQGGGVGSFGLGGTGGHGVAGAGGAGWYGGGGGGTSAWGSTLGGNGGGGSSYTNPSRCTSVVHTQGYRNGNGYITLTPVR